MGCEEKVPNEKRIQNMSKNAAVLSDDSEHE